MKTTILFYTRDNCPACQTMKTALKRLGVGYTEVKPTKGAILPPDVRSFPTLAVEKAGKRTTICKGWPGSLDQLKKRLEAVKKNRP